MNPSETTENHRIAERVPDSGVEPTPKLRLHTTSDGARIVESFVDSDLGLEHHLVILAPPEPRTTEPSGGLPDGSRPLLVDVQLDSTPAAQPDELWSSTLVLSDDARSVDVRSPDGSLHLRYGVVQATDASGKEVPVHLAVVEDPAADPIVRVIRLQVEGQNASFPVRIVLIASANPLKDVANSTTADRAAEQMQTPLVPPGNDSCLGAVSIPNGSFPVLTSPVDVIDATTTGDPVFCATTDRTIWYTFTSPASGSYTITTCASAGAAATTMPDTVLAVYGTTGGCAAPGPALVCNDDDVTCTSGNPSGRQSTVAVSLTGGSAYFIVVGRYAGVGAPPPQAGFTTIQLAVSQMLAPSNDSCAGTVPALSLNTPVDGTTFLAANDYQLSPVAPTCFTLPASPPPVGNNVTSGAGRDVVYSFQAPAAGPYSFRATGYSVAQNPILYVAGACPTGVAPVIVGNPPCIAAANRNASSGAEEVMCLSLGLNQRVYLFVDDSASGNAGSLFRVEASACVRETEPNGTSATADPLACPVEGSIDPASDVDFYALGAPAAGSRVFALSDGVASNLLDHVMRVTTSVDTLEFDDDDNDAPFGLLSPNIAGASLTAVGPFIRVNAFRTDIAGEPYRLYAVVQPASSSAVAESEPNDTLPTADSGGANYFSGTLAGPAPSTDVDLFRFTARAGTLITLNLDGDPPRNGTPIDPALDLLDATGKILVSVSNAGAAESTTSGAGSLTSTTPFAPGEGLTYRTSATGQFYARIMIGTTSNTSIGVGDYLLSVGLNCLAGDSDGDGVADGADCAAANAALWSIPSDAKNLMLAGHAPTSLVWSAPASLGANTVRYDLLRSTTPADFSAAHASCIESDDTNTAASDSGARPPAGTAYSYLVRVENGCGGFMGSSSAGVPRTGRSCP